MRYHEHWAAQRDFSPFNSQKCPKANISQNVHFLCVWNAEKQIAPCESTAEEVFIWMITR